MYSPPNDINSDYPENTVSSKYYDIEELQNLKLSSKRFTFPYYIYMHVLLVRTLTTFNTFSVVQIKT